ncbi:tetratricopeptide repeat protein (plasmid) [Bacillus sp. 31A1R]|uniref:Tetratricopeptide repeat protein n=1 Tax=Robertmurraya mangrovi TaxID=3098077 RepID=A0ABU5IUE2_9BACI|nr:tetratricopeptide repeat protein [Bacillus sp. 31A1R]MDZ5470777.1 tetratricopeptide repeat protein [Bacillus sp. 31A1R]
MKKRERKKKVGNVVFFPDIEKRLLEKGLEQLQNKDFKQAVTLFEEARKLDHENSDIHIGLVLSYYEAGYLQEAKKVAKEMLKEGIGDYIQAVDLYLMILVQLHEYDEIVTTIEVLLEEREVPIEKYEHFSRMLEFSRRMAEGKAVEDGQVDVMDEVNEFTEASRPLQLDLFTEGDPRELMLTIAQLSNVNIRPYLDQIKQYLKSSEGHPFLKTMLINVLMEHEYDKEVVIEKFNRQQTVEPTQLPNIHDNPQKLEIANMLNTQLEHEDPVLLEHIMSLVERHLFLMYPFELSPGEPRDWAAAYHLVAVNYHGYERTARDVCEVYDSNEENVENAHAFITKIEEISYPII